MPSHKSLRSVQPLPSESADMTEEYSVAADIRVRNRMIAMDAISNELCTAADLAMMCSQIHSDAAFRSAASASLCTLHRFMDELNMDRELLVRALTAMPKQCVHRFTEEEIAFVNDVHRESVEAGVHISDPLRREALLGAMDRLRAAESAYADNMMPGLRINEAYFDLGPLSAHDHERLMISSVGGYLQRCDALPHRDEHRYARQCASSSQCCGECSAGCASYWSRLCAAAV